jgi:surface antigen
VLLCLVTVTAGAQNTSTSVRIMRDSWSDADERGFIEFIEAIGNSRCGTIDRCMKSAANPFAKTDPPGVYFAADCADLPYFLRGYYAWKRGLPFSYISAVSPRGATRDIRYTSSGNTIASRRDVLTGSTSGRQLLVDLRNGISSAMFRLHPDMEGTDLYPVRIDRKSLKPGSVLYDPNGHVAVVYKVEEDGRVLFMDAHPDNSLTRGTYGKKFVRSSPGMGSGFKNWRPLKLVGATTTPDGALVGGRVVFSKNAELTDFSTEQFFGNVARPADREWASGQFTIEGQQVDYYDYVRAKMGGGSLTFEPVQEVRNMVRANCEDLRYRAEAVDLAIRVGIQNKAQPSRLPTNIYGTEGEWEEYSTPSRDARLKASFKELRDQVQRFVEWHNAGDKRVRFQGGSIVQALLKAYDEEAALCTITYLRSNGTPVPLGYEEIRKRLFLLSFDPYHCIERRWGASQPAELATCRDDATKAAWYAAEQGFRNQIDRTYDARMDFTLAELQGPIGPGKGAALPADIDVRGFLLLAMQRQARAPSRPPILPASGPASVGARPTTP